MSDVQIHGPVFDGRAEHALGAAADAAGDRAGAYVRDELGRIVDTEAPESTGYYSSRLTIQRAADTTIITDRGLAYGAWLEGTSRRNDHTRFKGHHHFRRVVQDLNDNDTVTGFLQEEIDKRRGELE